MTTPSPSFAYLRHPHPLAFAHRGAHSAGDENTGEAFERAVGLGYRYIESDVQASRDGVPVVFHDDTLTRTMGVDARIADLPWPEIERLRTPGGQGLMRLDDALSSFPETRFNLDAKSEAVVGPMADAIRRCGAETRVCVASFDVRRTLRLLALLGPDVCWSPSQRGVTRLWAAGWGVPAGRLDFPAVQVPTSFRGIPLVTRRFVDTAHARGIQIHVWTIDDEAEMERLLDLGVDGLMTDRAEVLKAVLQRRGQWDGT